MTDRYIIGQNIAALRKEAGLTQTELADRLHVSHQAISQWERGETLPDILTLPALAEIFGQTAGVLLGTEEKDSLETQSEYRQQSRAGDKSACTGIQTEYRITVTIPLYWRKTVSECRRFRRISGSRSSLYWKETAITCPVPSPRKSGGMWRVTQPSQEAQISDNGSEGMSPSPAVPL